MFVCTTTFGYMHVYVHTPCCENSQQDVCKFMLAKKLTFSLVSFSVGLQNATLTVGSGCDTNIAILYGDRLGNYSCAARVTHSLPDR